MRIGIIIGRIGDVDGVALETEKWITVLQEMGHEIFLLAGRYSKDIIEKDHETLLPDLSFFSPNCEWEQNRAFFFPKNDPDELLDHLNQVSDELSVQMFQWLVKNKIDVIITENASALPAHLSMGMAIRQVVEKTGIKTICHDHDFHWERGDRFSSPYAEIEKIITDTFPLQVPQAIHAVINTYGKEYLKEKYNIDSIMVPNVMDFNQTYGVKDDYNHDLLDSVGINGKDIPLFQVTRIVRRKGIETALELVERLGDKHVKLVITGNAADDKNHSYYNELNDIINNKRINDQVFFAGQRIQNFRRNGKNGDKIYALHDAYANAEACTYFSKYEGFGNAFIEATLAKKPIFVNNYRPVYWPDIGSKGFKTVMIRDNVLTDQAIEEIDTILHDKELQREIGEHNYKLSKSLYSFDVLREKLETIIAML